MFLEGKERLIFSYTLASKNKPAKAEDRVNV